MGDECMRELLKYQCHKQVWALKIKEVITYPEGAKLVPENEKYGPVVVTAEYVDKHKPIAGGYYVVYADGYNSFSPASAFESGYSPVK